MVGSHADRDTGRLFVGRRREMVELTAALEDALGGQGRLVMLAGEPGIGKIRTAQELAALAEGKGAKVLWGWCYDEEGALPYWPWIQPMRSYVRQTTHGQLRQQMGLGATDIAEIIDDVKQKLPDLDPPLELENPDQARFRLFDSITSFLKTASQGQPMVIILDDLQWADRSSLLLLEFLAKEISSSRLLLLATHREADVATNHPLSQALGNLVREQHFRRIHLGGLSQQEVGEFIESGAGVRLAADALESVYGRTDGNPFFLGELVNLLGKDDMPEADEWQAAIPEGVRQALGRRLSRLSEICKQALNISSVIGREFDLHLLLPLAVPITELDLLSAIDEALEAQLIQEVPEQAERFRFSHALIQEALAQELSATRRTRLHAQIAQSLEEIHGAVASVHAAELAHHFSRARTLLGPDKLVHYSLLAGERALAIYAYEDALAHFQRGLDARSDLVDSETAALLFGIGRAQAATLDLHHITEALQNFNLAFDYYSGAGEVERAVAVAEYPGYGFMSERAGVTRLIDRALRLVSPGSLQEARLLARYGIALQHHMEGNEESVADSFDRALAIAQREGDTKLEMRMMVSQATFNGSRRRRREALTNYERVIELGSAVAEPETELHALYGAAVESMILGDLQAADRYASSMLMLAERMRDRWWLTGALWRNSVVNHLRGYWPASRDFGDRGLEVTPGHWHLLADRAILECEVGELTQCHAHLDRLIEVLRLTGPLRTAAGCASAVSLPLAAHITGIDYRLEIAQEAAEAILASPTASPIFTNRARMGMALLAVLRDDATLAARQYAALEDSRGEMAANNLAGDRVLGLVAQTMGDPDQAVSHFEDSLAFCRKAGYRPELAWTCNDYAETLIERAGADDRQKAVDLLDESLGISTELGMRPLMERVSALQEKAENLAPRPALYPDGLTQREVEVLRLVAAGKSNPEIGEELFISPRTVTTHVSNILNKINAANRAEAATYAARQGLV